MGPSELESFVVKFKSLWLTGQEAHLHVNSQKGQAWVTLSLGLGSPPPPPSPPFRPLRNGPSRQRRCARRQAAREDAAEKADTAAQNIEVTTAPHTREPEQAVEPPAEKAKAAENADTAAENVEVTTPPTRQAEQAIEPPPTLVNAGVQADQARFTPSMFVMHFAQTGKTGQLYKLNNTLTAIYLN